MRLSSSLVLGVILAASLCGCGGYTQTMPIKTAGCQGNTHCTSYLVELDGQQDPRAQSFDVDALYVELIQQAEVCPGAPPKDFVKQHIPGTLPLRVEVYIDTVLPCVRYPLQGSAWAIMAGVKTKTATFTLDVSQSANNPRDGLIVLYPADKSVQATVEHFDLESASDLATLSFHF